MKALAIAALVFVAAAAIALWSLSAWGSAEEQRCERAVLQNLARDLPIGTTRDELMTVLASDWEVTDAGSSQLTARAFTYCGFGSNGHVEARFDLVADEVTGCLLTGTLAGVQQRCQR